MVTLVDLKSTETHSSEQWHGVVCFILRLLLGSVASVIAKTLSAPFERIKIVGQCTNKDRSRGFWPTAVYIYEKQGLRSFWNGNFANCLRAVPKFALDVSIKAELFDLLTRLPAFDAENNSERLAATILSGSIAAIISSWVKVSNF